jgi:spore maturation protein CgeB
MQMKKLLFIPLDFQYRPHDEMYNAFCTQFNTLHYCIFEDAVAFQPDYIYLQGGALDPFRLSDLKKITGAKVIQWTGDCRLEPLPEIIANKDIADITLLAAGIGQKKMYEDILKHPVEYWQHGVADSHFRELKTGIEPKKVRFIGNAYSQFEGGVERNALCELLTEHLEEFEVWGSGFADKSKYRNPDTIPYRKIFDLYNETYIGISANIFNSIEGYWSNRPLDIMAAGSCCLMRYVPNLEIHFEDMENAVFYYNNMDALDKIRYLLKNKELRNEIAENGQKLVKKYHTFEYRALELKNIISLHYE